VERVEIDLVPWLLLFFPFSPGGSGGAKEKKLEPIHFTKEVLKAIWIHDWSADA